MKSHLLRLLLGVGAVASLGTSAWSATVTYDFSSDPASDPNFIIASNLPDLTWRSSGGNPGGYIAITDAANSQASQLLFPDIDEGKFVKAFTFACDLRIGNGTGNDGRPADGFSINYARANDPQVENILANFEFADGSGYAASGALETGTTTGIAVSFDTWSGNTLPDGPDIEGIIVRVDNVTIQRVGLSVRNGACDDVNSLQTGPWDGEVGVDPGTGSPDGLCWQKFEINLAENGALTVSYKGRLILDKFATGFIPSAGRLLFAGRTGSANENHHVDNVSITTVLAEGVAVAGIQSTPFGCTVSLTDVGPSILDPASLVFKFDGAIIPTADLQITKSGETTTIVYEAPSILASGSQHQVDLEFKDTRGIAGTGSAPFTVSTYATLPTALRSPLGSEDTTKPGFNIRTWQLEARTDPAPTQPNNNEWGEGALAGLVGDNVADLTGFADGVYAESETINYSHTEGETNGNFTPDRQHPGIPGLATVPTENYQSEFVAYIPFASPGLYTMGVNSDDNFRVTVGDQVGRQYLEVLAPEAIAGGMAAVATSSGLNVNPGFGGSLPTTPIEAEAIVLGTSCLADPELPDLTGKIAVIPRGTCTFVEKCRNAQSKGALAVVIANSEANAVAFPIIMGGDGTDVTLPVMMLDYDDGQKLINNPTGLRLSIGKDTNLQLGEFNAAGRGAADTTFTFYVPEVGVYPFRCFYMQGNGGGNVEWFTVSGDGTKVLLNDTAEGALKTYRARTFTPPPTTPEISISQADGGVTITFTAGTLQSAPAVTGPWTDVAGATSPVTLPTTGPGTFYRARN